MIRFISCDWGTSAFRLRLIEDTAGRGPAKVLASLSNTSGIAAVYAEWQRSGSTDRVAFFRGVLERAIAELVHGQAAAGDLAGGLAGVGGLAGAGGLTGAGDLDGACDLAGGLDGVPMVISGMASSSIGMYELPYREIPFDLSGSDLSPRVLPATAESPRTVLLVPGLRSADDVMRGEETQLLGCGGGSGVFIFPGTHSKHMLVQERKLVAFQTFMTGELFGLLSTKSILAASVSAPSAGSDVAASAGSGAATSADLLAAFYAGVDAAQGSGLLHGAFLTRTNQLFQKYDKEDNYHFLSGLLIGEELRGLISRGIGGSPDAGLAVGGTIGERPVITLVAASPLRQLYAAALIHLGFRDVAQIDADQALIAGHCTIFTMFLASNAPWKNP